MIKIKQNAIFSLVLISILIVTLCAYIINADYAVVKYADNNNTANCSSTIQFTINVTNNNNYTVTDLLVNDSGPLGSSGSGIYYNGNNSNPNETYFFPGNSVAWLINISANNYSLIFVNFSTTGQTGNYTNLVNVSNFSNSSQIFANYSATYSIVGNCTGNESWLNVNLIFPLTNYTFNSSPFLFNYTVVGLLPLNCTLWGNFNSSWAANQTSSNVSMGNTTGNNFTIDSLGNGDYLWNVWCTNGTIDSWAPSNGTFSVNTTVPTNNLSGYVKYLNNVSVADYNLTLHVPMGPGNQTITTTDSGGYYNFSNIEEGLYSLEHEEFGSSQYNPNSPMKLDISNWTYPNNFVNVSGETELNLTIYNITVTTNISNLNNTNYSNGDVLTVKINATNHESQAINFTFFLEIGWPDMPSSYNFTEESVGIASNATENKTLSVTIPQSNTQSNPEVRAGVDNEYNQSYTNGNVTVNINKAEGQHININLPDIEIHLVSPLNGNQTENNNISFQYNVTRIKSESHPYNCTLILNGTDNATDSNNPIIINDTNQNYTGIINSTLANGTYGWTIKCNNTDTSNIILAEENWSLSVGTPGNNPPIAEFYSYDSVNISGTWMTFAGGTIGVWGYANDTDGDLANWTLSLYLNGTSNGTLCTNASLVDGWFDGWLCDWNTTQYCAGECENYTLILNATDTQGNWNATPLVSITIDNIVPNISENASISFYPPDKEYNISVNISESYIQTVNAYIFNANDYTILMWSHLCNESQGENCDQILAGTFSNLWHSETYSLNNTNVSVYHRFGFQNMGNDSQTAAVPGCFKENDSVNYTCGSGGYESNEPYRYWLVYNFSNGSDEGTFIGLTSEQWCSEGVGCELNTTLIQNGNSSFMLQHDYYNYSIPPGFVSENSSELTLYTPGNSQNENLTSSSAAEGQYYAAFEAVDYVGNYALKAYLLNVTEINPYVSLQYTSEKLNWNNGKAFVRGILQVEGYANGTNFSNWTLALYMNGTLNETLCFNASPADGWLCDWNTSEYCTGECDQNYSLMLNASNSFGDLWWWGLPLIIDNIPPEIKNDTFNLTKMGEEFIFKTNITDTYLMAVSAYIFNELNETVIGFGQSCSEAQGDNCNNSESGRYNKSWSGQYYSLNNTNVPVYYKFGFNNMNGSTEEIPGCFDENGTGDYDCGGECGNNSGCNSYRWWLVYGYNNESNNNTLLGLTNEQMCEYGCEINASIIHNNGTSRFKIQSDYFNFSSREWQTRNISEITLYFIGNSSNPGLISVPADGNYRFAFDAVDYAGNYVLRAWNFSVAQQVHEMQLYNTNLQWMNINGTNYAFVSGNYSILGTVNDSNLINWTVKLFKDTVYNATLCNGTSNITGTLCTWNTTAYCPNDECGNYTIWLNASIGVGSFTPSTIGNITIDNKAPFINSSAEPVLHINSYGGPVSNKQYELNVSITDNYLRDVYSYILDNNTLIVNGLGRLCIGSGENCSAISGTYSRFWNADSYYMNNTNITVYTDTHFDELNDSYVGIIPGCFAQGGSDYDCGIECAVNDMNCSGYEYWLVFNISQNISFAGIYKNQGGNYSGPPYINNSLITSGTSKFKPQLRYFNESTNDINAVNTSLTLTLYIPINDTNNPKLYSYNTNGQYRFLFTADDYVQASSHYWTINVDGISPSINSLSLLNPDIFFSPYDNIINITANVSDDQAVGQVVAELWGISNNTCNANCSDNETCSWEHCTVELNLSNSTGLWTGSVNVSSYITAAQQPAPYGIPIDAYDTSFNRNEWSNTSMLPVVLHDLGVPSTGNNSYMRFGNQTTNFSKEPDFSDVNFIMDIEVNVSGSPAGWQDGCLINLTTVNLSNEEAAGKLGGLGGAIEVHITGPHQYGNSRIYINTTYFKELNRTAVITFFNLPFTEKPQIQADIDAAGLTDNGTWVSAYNSLYNITTGNLTFTVAGFSGYNISDTVPPIINISYPQNNTNYNSNITYVNFTVNGTGTEPSIISLQIDATEYIFNNSPGSSNLSCYNASLGSELYLCNQPVNLGDGNHNISVNAWDFGGETGNHAESAISFNVDTIPPTLSNHTEYPSPATYAPGQNYSFNITVNDNVAVGNVWINFDGINYSAINISHLYIFNITNLAAGTHNYTWFANDSAGNTNNTGLLNYTITLATPQLSLTASPGWNVTYGTSTNVSCTANTNQVTPSLLRNGLSVSIPNYEKLGAGTYNYTCSNNATQNYTSSFNSTNLTVNKAASVMNVLLNGNDSDLNVELSSNVTIYANLSGFNDMISILKNGTIIQSGMSPLTNITLFDTLGTYNITANYSGNANYTGNYKTHIINVTPDVTKPLVTGVQANPTIINQTQSTNITATVTDFSSLTVLAEITLPNSSAWNYSMSNTSTLYNLTFNTLINYPKGVYNVRIYATDAYNNVNSSQITNFTVNDVTAPAYSNLVTAPSSPVTYAPGALYNFNATWIDNLDLSRVWMNWSGTIYSTANASNVYMFNITNLSAGVYTYVWYANDTSGNTNNTGLLTYNVTTANSTCSLIFNPVNSVVYNNSVTINCSCTGDGTAQLYRDSYNVTNEIGVAKVLGAGNYTYNCSVPQTTNYNLASNSSIYFVNQTAPSIYLTETHNWNLTYGTAANVSCTANTNQINLSLYRNNVSLGFTTDASVLGAGNYVYICNNSASQNYTASLNTSNLTVNKANDLVNLSLNGNINTNISVVYPANVTAIGYSLSGTDAVYRNETLVNESLAEVLGVGVWAYTVNTTGNENYTANATGLSYYVQVNKTNSAVNLLLNGQDNDINVSVEQNVTINATLVTGQRNILLYADNVLINNGTLLLSNMTSYSEEGTHNITVVYNATQNYSSSFETHFINVTDNIPPAVNLSYPANNTWNTSLTLLYGYYVNDTNSGIQNCSFYFDGAFKYVNSSITEGLNAFNHTATGGTHTWYVKCYDNSSQKNSRTSDTWTIKLDNQPPTTILLGVTNGTSYASNVSITFSTTENGNSGINRTEYNLSVSWQNYTSAINYGTEGTATIYYRSIDNAGNIEAVQQTTFTIDTTGPSINITSPVSGANISGSAYFNVTAVDNGQNASHVVFKIDSTQLDDDSSYPFSYTLVSTSYSDGNHTLVATAYDSLGNYNSTNITIFIDNTRPTSAITYPPNNHLTKGAVNVNGTASDSGIGLSYVEIYNGTAWNNATLNGTSWNYTASFDASGTYTIKSRATDKNGNQEIAGTGVNIIYDNTPPTISNIQMNPNPASNATPVYISAEVSDANGVMLVNATLNGTTANLSLSSGNTYAGMLTSPVAQGIYNLTLSAADNASNSAVNSSYQLTVNTSTPIITITPVNGSVFANGTLVEINVSNANTSYYNTSANPTPVNFTGYVSFNVSGEGSYSVYVWANTSGGNTAEKENSYILDNTAPIVDINSVSTPTNIGTQNVSGNITDDNLNYVTLNGLFAILDGNNYWKIVSLDEGNNTILIRAYDKAGLYGNETGNIFLDSITPSTSHSISGTLGENGWYTTNTTLTLTTDDGNLSSGYVTQYNKGSGLANYTSPIVISNSASVTYRAYDNAGNTESNRTTGLIKIDKQAPSVTNLTISTSLPAVNETLAIRANITDVGESGLAAQQIVNIDGTNHSMILESGNIYKYDFTPSQKKNYSIRVYARDSAGNQNNSASYGFAASVKKTEIGASFQNDTPLVRDYTNQTSTALDIAVNSSVTGNITVALFSDTPAFANTTLSNGIKFVDINLSDNVGDVLRWILIKVYYTDAEISGLDESTLKLSWYNQSSGTWVTMSAGSPSWVNSTGVDTVNNYVWANVSHLSLYGINGSTAAAPPTPPPEEEGVTTTISPNVIYLNGTQQILQMTSAYKVQTHVGNLLYEITIQNFTQGKNVTFKISSASASSYVTVNKGETKILDLNADGQADLSIKAIDIASYYANVLFEKLAATPPAAPSANVTNNTGTPGPATPGVTPPATPPKPKVTITAQLLIFAISSTAVIILLAALIILEYRKKRKLTA